MGKLTQAWQADDGQFFGTEGEMLGHERDVQVAKLGESWHNFVDSRAEGYEYESNYDLEYTPTEILEDVIEYLKRELENRTK